MEDINAVKRIHEFLKFGSVLGLERMNNLMDKLDNPQEDLKIIHVAGTNGKGSVCRYTYEILRNLGFSVGLFTSPYIEIFNERIEINGKYISNRDLEKYSDIVISKADEMIAEGYDSPTEFEIVTAIALLFFAEKKCDFTILEVGLGGRGDSTNIIKSPICCGITSISMDHTDILGDTIEKIAYEKAGIIKHNCPVVMGAGNPKAKKIIEEKAKEMEANLIDATESLPQLKEKSGFSCIFDVCIMGHKYSEVELSMLGLHQVENAIIALHIIETLKKENYFDKIIEEGKDFDFLVKDGLKKAIQIGRFEILNKYNDHGSPYIIIDGAHNIGGSEALKNSMKKYFKNKKVLMIVGILRDKAVDPVVKNFLEITKDFIVTEPENPRKLMAEEFSEVIKSQGGNVIIRKEPKEAVKLAISKKDNYDVILFSGSLYLIGEIRGEILGGLR